MTNRAQQNNSNNGPTDQTEKKEDWKYTKNCRPNQHIPIVFESVTGKTYTGYRATVNPDNAKRQSPMGFDAVGQFVFVAESMGPDQFFNIDQILRWKETTRRFPKVRMIDHTVYSPTPTAGILMPIFLNYFQLRQVEKCVEGNRDIGTAAIDNTTMYTDELDSVYWLSSIHSNQGDRISLEECMDSPVIKVIAEGPARHEQKFHYKDVAEAVEWMCSHLWPNH